MPATPRSAADQKNPVGLRLSVSLVLECQNRRHRGKASQDCHDFMDRRTALLAHFGFCSVRESNSVVRASFGAATAQARIDGSICAQYSPSEVIRHHRYYLPLVDRRAIRTDGVPYLRRSTEQSQRLRGLCISPHTSTPCPPWLVCRRTPLFFAGTSLSIAQPGKALGT